MDKDNHTPPSNHPYLGPLLLTALGLVASFLVFLLVVQSNRAALKENFEQVVAHEEHTLSLKMEGLARQTLTLLNSLQVASESTPPVSDELLNSFTDNSTSLISARWWLGDRLRYESGPAPRPGKLDETVAIKVGNARVTSYLRSRGEDSEPTVTGAVYKTADDSDLTLVLEIDFGAFITDTIKPTEFDQLGKLLIYEADDQSAPLFTYEWLDTSAPQDHLLGSDIDLLSVIDSSSYLVKRQVSMGTLELMFVFIPTRTYLCLLYTSDAADE